jgi:hypothetical protein
MRHFAVVSAAVLAALFATGCGGSQVQADPVPSGPVVLTLPHDSQLAPGAASTTKSSSSATPTPTPTPTPAAGTGTGTGTSSSGSGTTGNTTAPSTGGAQTPQQAPAQATPKPATGGADANQGLDQFCQDNPGAC